MKMTLKYPALSESLAKLNVDFFFLSPPQFMFPCGKLQRSGFGLLVRTVVSSLILVFGTMWYSLIRRSLIHSSVT